MTWTRSSACTYGNCVEVRHVDGHVEVRDNTAPDTVLRVTPADWALFLVGAKAGEFDGPAMEVRPAYEPDGSVYDEPPVSADALAVAIADPASILPRDYSNGIETVPSWAARAVRALLGIDTTPGTS